MAEDFDGRFSTYGYPMGEDPPAATEKIDDLVTRSMDNLAENIERFTDGMDKGVKRLMDDMEDDVADFMDGAEHTFDRLMGNGDNRGGEDKA